MVKCGSRVLGRCVGYRTLVLTMFPGVWFQRCVGSGRTASGSFGFGVSFKILGGLGQRLLLL